ncbi:HlyD family type I secretion periplasmic adaptor subunit [Piscinibacter sakaiensis]|uniref:HlyD family type I secretion periplasmic adaptor subunit n=1 Tax=Piscinibacter sakaiensis TaxID=1547922 RepID=UPI003AAC0225
MASANKSSVAAAHAAIDFLPDADEIERRPFPRVTRMMLHLLLAAMLCFVVWAAVSKVDLVVVAQGRLVTPLPNIVVQPLETSIIQTIDVRAGQVVRKGDRLATLDPTFAQADESQLRNRLSSLNTQLAAIEGELSRKMPAAQDVPTQDGQIQSRLSSERQATYASQLRRQSESIARLRSALETARQDEQALALRVQGLQEMERMTDDLVSKKLAVTSRLLDARDRLMEAERARELARNRQIELRRELSAVEAEKSSFETGWRQKLLEEMLAVSRERDAVNDQLQKANRRQSMVVLTAPADAVVLDVVKLSAGSIVKEAEPFFTLVPIGDVLEAEVQVGSQDVGYLKIGDHVRAKLDAFPFQKHGMLTGSLRTISQDAYRKDERARPGPDGYYSTRVAFTTYALDNMPAHARLLPGMAVTAEMVVGKRSVLSYLFWPLTKAMNESIREP